VESGEAVEDGGGEGGEVGGSQLGKCVNCFLVLLGDGERAERWMKSSEC